MCKLGGAVVFFLICMINLMAKDVYDAIPTVVTTFVAIIAKISIFIFLLELIYYTGQPVFGFN
jgi:NADH:ubiquinone oxidoreductase subunit 2 (subunit N)